MDALIERLLLEIDCNHGSMTNDEYLTFITNLRRDQYIQIMAALATEYGLRAKQSGAVFDAFLLGAAIAARQKSRPN